MIDYQSINIGDLILIKTIDFSLRNLNFELAIILKTFNDVHLLKSVGLGLPGIRHEIFNLKQNKTHLIYHEKIKEKISSW